jgi:LacI family transcriptional regulator
MAVVTIMQIAQSLGLAHTTVSRALNDHPTTSLETKLRVREAAEAMGYIRNSSARQMRDGSSNVVGLVFPDVQNEFFSAAALSMSAHCIDSGYQMFLALSGDDPHREEQHIRAMRENRVAGIMLAPCGAPTPRTHELLRQIPWVQFLRWSESLGGTGVYADDRQGVAEATRHLLQLGHQRIGYIGPSRGLSTGAQRLEGHSMALREKGLEADDALHYFGAARPEAGAAGLKTLLARSQPPTAIVVASPQQTSGVMRAAYRAGIEVPNGLSIVAYGDTHWFEACSPAMTAVRLPVEQMCETATRMLFDLVERSPGAAGKAIEREVFATSLMVRGTTQKVRVRATAARR